MRFNQAAGNILTVVGLVGVSLAIAGVIILAIIM